MMVDHLIILKTPKYEKNCSIYLKYESTMIFYLFVHVVLKPFVRENKHDAIALFYTVGRHRFRYDDVNDNMTCDKK